MSGRADADLVVAAAQMGAVPGDIVANVGTHQAFMKAAAKLGVSLLVFPELSLTGYELPLAKACVLQPEDERLAPIRDLAGQLGMVVSLGAPVGGSVDGMPAIGAIIFFADGSSCIYRKQHLHPGEDQYVVPGEPGCRLHVHNGVPWAHAICADTSHRAHAASAAAYGASLYLAGVLVSEAGYAADAGNLQQYAAELGMGVLMANHGAPSGGYQSAGRSAFWAPGGRQVVAAPGAGDALVVASLRAGAWQGACHAV